MVKKIFLSILLFAALFFGANRAIAADPLTVYFFWGDGCPHCAKEEVFLEEMKSKYPQITVRDFEVWKNAENQKLLADLGKKLNINISGVPFTVAGEKYFTGWFDRQTTGRAIEEAIIYEAGHDCTDLVAGVISSNEETGPDGKDCVKPEDEKNIPQTIDVPVFGRIEVKNFSLPVLAVVLGGLDGFNPCAMWTLIFLISLLLGMEDRKRMWMLGGAFIFASSLVYFIFMAAWLNLILFIGFIFWVRFAVGLVSLGAGGYNLKEYFANKKQVCKVTADPKKQRTFEKLKAVTQKKNFYLALGGIILLAFAVNLVELICSAGFPVVFTQILAMSGLSGLAYYLYIFLYIFFFMLDDMIVFFIAMATLKMAGVTTKYGRLSKLIGGALMLAIGLLLIFKPEWLMFG